MVSEKWHVTWVVTSLNIYNSPLHAYMNVVKRQFTSSN